MKIEFSVQTKALAQVKSSRFLCSPSHIRCVEIFDEPRNCCRTWNILVVVFLNCSCEINFKAPSRYRKGCVIRKKIFHSDSFFFFDTAKNKKVNKQSSSTKISRFDENFYASNGEHINGKTFLVSK
jgi:hypothetical protein